MRYRGLGGVERTTQRKRSRVKDDCSAGFICMEYLIRLVSCAIFKSGRWPIPLAGDYRNMGKKRLFKSSYPNWFTYIGHDWDAMGRLKEFFLCTI